MKLTLPLRVKSGKKDFILNLNNYRNAHHFTLNNAKMKYTALVVAMLPMGNQKLAKISVKKAALARHIKALKKKHKDSPAMFDVLSGTATRDFEVEENELLELAASMKKIRVRERVILRFCYYHGNRHKIDTSNPCSIIDKFTCDALTAAGFWADDDSKAIALTQYEPCGVDKDNPRCELIIERCPIECNNPD